MTQVGQMCGEGSHPVCQGHDGLSAHHYDHATELDNGLSFTCACGCHYVPAYLGQVFVLPPTPLEPGRNGL